MHDSMTEPTNLRIAVIGAGPGGYAAAFLAADLGMTVTLIDPEINPGGVCLYRGCIPSKALLHVAKLIDESRHAKNWGIDYADPKIDLPRLRSWKEGGIHPGPRCIRELEHAARQPSQRQRRFTDLRSYCHRHGLAARDHSQPQTRNPAHDGFNFRAGLE